MIKKEALRKKLHSIEKEIVKKRARPKKEYIKQFQDNYSKYTLDKLSERKITRRYRTELALLVFFKKVLENINPNISVERWEQSKHYSFPEIETEAEFLVKPEEILDLYLNATEILLNKKEKYFCEFYTPKKVSETLIKSIPEKDLEDGKKTILDPCCGTGNLLATIFARYLKKDREISDINDFLGNRIYGYDVLPFSLLVTRMQLVTFHQAATGNSTQPPKMNLDLKDTLHDKTPHEFSYIISNPPYKKTHNNLSLIKRHKDYLKGHPNLYILFLLWSLENIEREGHVIFLLPQTIRTGMYSHPLRKLINEAFALEEITIFSKKSTIFPDVEQMIMIIDISKRKRKRDIRVRFQEDEKESAVLVPRKRFFRKTRTTLFFQIPHNKKNLNIIDKVCQNSEPLEENDIPISINTGTYVWNQHKDMLSKRSGKKKMPLVYANSIQDYRIRFPINFENEEKGEFTRPVRQVKPSTGERILMKRTTAPSEKRKIKASLLPKSFLETYEKYHLENHVNHLKVQGGSSGLHKALTCYLNSSLVNYYFNSISASSQVSLYEIRALPLNKELIEDIAPLAQRFFRFHKKDTLKEIDRHIYIFFKLTEDEIREIRKSLGQE